MGKDFKFPTDVVTKAVMFIAFQVVFTTFEKLLYTTLFLACNQSYFAQMKKKNYCAKQQKICRYTSVHTLK